MYAVAAPLLYKKYPFNSGRHETHHSFIEALANSTALCRHARSLYCTQEWEKSTPIRKISMIDPKLRELAVPHSESFRSDLKRDRNAFIKLILCMTPQINELLLDCRITGYFHCLDFISSATCGAPYGNVHNFAHLKTIIIGLDDKDISQLSPIFLLPSLHTLILEFSWLNVPRPFHGGWKCPARVSPIKTLHLRGNFPVSVLKGVYRQLQSHPIETHPRQRSC
jgi:hypothetical protein